VTLSNESIRDAPISELDAVGAALARSVARRIDLTAFSTDAATAVSPPGLLVGVQAQTGGIATVDQFSRRSPRSPPVGGNGNAIFLNPADTLALQLLKQGTGSNVPLLAARRDAAGPLLHRRRPDHQHHGEDRWHGAGG
jgi:hypothetical protein